MNCDDNVLIGLLQDNPIADDQAISAHVARCTRCQERLTELAADEASWGEVAVALRDTIAPSSVVIALDAELTSDMPLQADRIPLDFLEEPRHPEMMGRIGRYDVERLVGAGGMGIVFKAFDTELHRPVAVKLLAPHLAHSGGARQRFAREAQSAAAVVHENVVPIHNVEVADKLPYLVMQFVAGESLQSRVDREGPLSTDEVLRIGAQIARGLAAAHAQGLVHRDVKPGNILLEERIDRVLISDFGLARAADDASVTRSGVIAGTPHYMSPEQARGEFVDVQSDLFGLGSVLYFMCTGRPPFRAEGAMAVLHRICSEKHRPVDDVNERVPSRLAELIDRLLQKEPARRPRAAKDVARQLTLFLQNTRSRGNLRRRHPVRQTAVQALGALSAFIGIVFVGWQLISPTLLQTPRNSLTPKTRNNLKLPAGPQAASATVPKPPTVSPTSAESILTDMTGLDVFRDSHLEAEIDELTAGIAEYGMAPTTEDSTLPLEDRAWFDALEMAEAISQALEANEGVEETGNVPTSTATQAIE